MADPLSKEMRSKNMRAIRSVSKLENRVAQELWRRGVRFRRNSKALFGKPDISIKKYKVVIFIDSCFWHGCEIHGRIPATNREFWEKKIERNKKRDAEVTEYYRNKGWHLMRVWEHSVKESPEYVINKMEWFVRSAKTECPADDILTELY